MNISATIQYIREKISYMDFAFEYKFIEDLRLFYPMLYKLLLHMIYKKLVIYTDIYEIIDYDKILHHELSLYLRIMSDEYSNSIALYDADYSDRSIYYMNILEELNKIDIDEYGNIAYLKYYISNILKPFDIGGIEIYEIKRYTNFINILREKYNSKNIEEYFIQYPEYSNFKNIEKYIQMRDINMIEACGILWHMIEHITLYNIYRVNKIKIMLMDIQNINNVIVENIYNYNNCINNIYEKNKLVYNIHNKIGENAEDNYSIYMYNIVHSSDRYMINTSLIHDYIILLIGHKNYKEILRLYKLWNLHRFIIRDYIAPYLRINIIYGLIIALYKEGDILEIIDVLYPRISAYLDNNNCRKIKEIQYTITKISAAIKFLDNKGYTHIPKYSGVTCMICLDDIVDITAIQCKSCMRIVSHAHCLSQWFYTVRKSRCPNCQYCSD